MCNKAVIIFTLFVLLLTFTGCDQPDSRLKIVNLSADTVFFVFEDRRKGFVLGERPIQYEDNGEIDLNWSNVVLPHDSINKMMRNNPEGWIDFVTYADDSKLRMYFFKKKLFDSLEWDIIVKTQCITEKKEFDLKELNANNWRIIYK